MSSFSLVEILVDPVTDTDREASIPELGIVVTDRYIGEAPVIMKISPQAGGFMCIRNAQGVSQLKISYIPFEIIGFLLAIVFINFLGSHQERKIQPGYRYFVVLSGWNLELLTDEHFFY